MSYVCKVHIFYMSAIPQTTAMMYSVYYVYMDCFSIFIKFTQAGDVLAFSSALCALLVC